MATAVTVFQVTSILSVFGSGMVVLTHLLFKSMQSKLFMRIIANISLADILANVEYTMSYRPSNDNWWCSTQGFLNLYGYPCSWLWTTMLMQFLHDLAVHKEVRLSIRTAYIVCWGLPLVTTLLYFAFIPHGTYERISGSDTWQICSYGGRREQGFAWHMVTYYGLFLACVVRMIYLYYNMRRAYRAKEQDIEMDERDSSVVAVERAALDRVKITSESLLLYPLIMIVCWTPHMIGVALNLATMSRGVVIYSFLATNLKILCGLAMAILFGWKSQAARTLWVRLLCGTKRSRPGSGLDHGDESLGSSFRDSSFAEHSLSNAHDFSGSGGGGGGGNVLSENALAAALAANAAGSSAGSASGSRNPMTLSEITNDDL
jgi:hypothetical protein